MAKPTRAIPTASQLEINEVLTVLNQVFARAAVGDFSRDVALPAEENEFFDFYIGVQTMLEVIREKISALEQAKTELEQEVWGKSYLLKELEKRKIKLEHDNAKDEALLASIGEGLIATNRSGKIILVNKAAQALLKFSSEELLGKSFAKMIKLKDEDGQLVPLKERPLYQVLRGGQKISSAVGQYVRKDGTTLSVVYTITPIIGSGQLLGCIGVFRDYTHEKEIDRVKSEFVSLASHQLRTPLTAINWYVQRLLSGRVGELEAKQKLYLTEVARGSRRMSELVTALLNVSRIELGTLVFTPIPTNISEIASDVLQEFQPQIEFKRLKVNRRLAKRLPKLMIDPKLLYMVLENLLENAIKYTPTKGQIKLIIKADTGNNLQITIQDTGYGIPAEQQPKIFHKLFRADNAKAQDTDGTGLGLYIVKSIIDYCHGTIHFTSQENVGSTFYVTLPVTKSVTPDLVPTK